MKALAIIPARGESKRIPRKNIRDFCGSPIIKYSIDAAINSKYFDEIMVSTDDKEIVEVAKKCRAKIPFLRSDQNSSDKAILTDVISEVLAKYEKLGQTFDLVCVILPTAPLLKSETLKKAFELIKKDNANSVIAVCAFGYPIQRAFRLNENRLEMLHPEFMSTNSQDLEASYHDAGQFYLLNVDKFKQQNKLFPPKTVAVILNESEVQDIDVEEDLKIAEFKYKLLNGFNQEE